VRSKTGNHKKALLIEIRSARVRSEGNHKGHPGLNRRASNKTCIERRTNVLRSSLGLVDRRSGITDIERWGSRVRPLGLSRASFTSQSLRGKGLQGVCAGGVGVNCLDEAVRAPRPMKPAHRIRRE